MRKRQPRVHSAFLAKQARTTASTTTKLLRVSHQQPKQQQRQLGWLRQEQKQHQRQHKPTTTTSSFGADQSEGGIRPKKVQAKYTVQSQGEIPRKNYCKPTTRFSHKGKSLANFFCHNYNKTNGTVRTTTTAAAVTTKQKISQKQEFRGFFSSQVAVTRVNPWIFFTPQQKRYQQSFHYNNNSSSHKGNSSSFKSRNLSPNFG